jgi:hypothetical protein
MHRSGLALAVVVLLAASPASAQVSTVIAACRFDAKGVCADAMPQGGQLAACIARNFPTLGESCKAALVRAAPVRTACAADIRQQCPDTKAGAGRLLFCVKAHYAALSEPCRAAIGQAAERNLRPQ